MHDTHTDFTHTIACVDRNYTYEESELLTNDKSLNSQSLPLDNLDTEVHQ